MNFVIARTRPEVGRLLTSADGIKCCKIISLGLKLHISAFEERLFFNYCSVPKPEKDKWV